MRAVLGLVAVALVSTAGAANAAGSLEARVAATEDRQAIEQLVGGDYVRALDSHNWAAYAATFTEDGELSVFGQTMKSRAAILTFFTTPRPTVGPQNKINHIISNLSYRIDAGRASGGAYWQDIGIAPNGLPGVLSAGHYEDTLRKVGGNWRFSKRTIVTDFEAPATPAATK